MIVSAFGRILCILQEGFVGSSLVEKYTGLDHLSAVVGELGFTDCFIEAYVVPIDLVGWIA